MKIGVISDTHIPERALDLPKEIYAAFKDCELILHAGDLISIDVLKSLEKICPVTAVVGNMDSPEVRIRLKEKEIISVGNFKIGLIHGKGHPKNLLDFIKGAFNDKLDAVVFGHSHTPLNEKKEGVLYFNPGSPTDTLFSPCRSYGILEIGSDIKGTIVKIS